MSVRASVYSAAASTYLIAAIQLVTMIVTTRLMTPSEVGLYSIALAVLLICCCLADWGVNIYIVQRHTTETEGLRACAWVAWTGALAVGSLMLLASGPLAAFYGAPEIEPLVQVLSLRVFLYPCGVVGASVVARDLRFKQLAVMNVSNALAQSTVSVVLVLLGARHMGLAIGYVAGFAAELFWQGYFEPRLFLLLPRPRGSAAIFRAGLLTTAIALLGTAAANASGLIIGYYLGARDTGWFTRASNLVNIVRRGLDGVINSVGIPAFSKAHAEGADMSKTFLAATVMLTGVAWPLFAMILALSEPLVSLLFGKAWLGIVPVGQILCVANMVMAMSVLSGALLLGIKRSGVLLRRETAAQSLIVLFILAGAQFSLPTVAVAIVAAAGVQLVITFHLLAQEIQLRWQQALAENLRSLAALAAAAVGAGVAQRLAGDSHVALQLVVGGSCGLACWLGAIWAGGHPLLGELARIRARLWKSPQTS